MAILLIAALATACSEQRAETEVAGPALGTTYSVKVITARGLDESERRLLRSVIEGQIDAIDMSMSTYRSDSELSRLNQAPASVAQAVSADLFLVLEAAARLSSESGGAFDVTVGPLVDAWGFGPVTRQSVPDDGEIADLLTRVGSSKLLLEPGQRTVTKVTEGLSIDLSAIAKGLAVDRVAIAISQAGYPDHLVEIGGEVRAHGRNRTAAPWTVAIEKPPGANQPIREAQRILRLQNLSLATSGDYRNYFELDGQRYSHTIDPRDGRPVRHRAAAVSVLHPEAMWADGYATALLVLGPEAGLRFANERNLAALFLVYNSDGAIEERTTPAFDSPLRPSS